jgi:uncharacterized membrane protein
MMVFWFLLIVLFVFGVTRMRRWHRGGCCGGVSHEHGGSQATVDIARERYAKGEISEEEFKKIRKDLLS